MLPLLGMRGRLGSEQGPVGGGWYEMTQTATHGKVAQKLLIVERAWEG